MHHREIIDGKASKTNCTCGKIFKTPAKLSKHIQKGNIKASRGEE